MKFCDCDCKDAKQKGLDFGSNYQEQCIEKRSHFFTCVLKNHSCDPNSFIPYEMTLYNHKEEHENVNDQYDCYKRCLNTKMFRCVASEIYNGICYLYDDSFKMAFDLLAKSYFSEIY